MRILLTGLGSIGRRHARLLYEELEEVELLIYRSGTSQSGNPFGAPEYTDLQDVLAQDPDIAFITNPTHKHIETATACARAGCHLFIEKPLSHTLENVERLIGIAKENDLVTHVGCQLRFDPTLNAAREIINSNDLGDVISFRATSGSYLPEWRPEQDYRDSYSADPERGGGVVLDLIHEIDYTYWLFDNISCVASAIAHTDTLEINSEAIAEAVMRVPGDVIGSIHLDYCRRQPKRVLEVVCEGGTVIADLQEQMLTIEWPSTTDTESFDYGRDRRFVAQLHHFIENVHSGGKCDNDLSEAKEVLQIALDVKGEYNG
ncbi:Predicted dehydrogenase [Halorubrum aquaticum]|uniref:Predicted dehydrogenase n=1 Tax=Halorubrum aquaticum TaxID=387340 RepID=A0A1I3A587_9EURY|nr:Gfo/Idh/MocA family oxidoreductase [Halorubrum aquaticum]SFH45277.1 Predicted dehydrogenase [Halorubrum aquaticum]